MIPLLGERVQEKHVVREMGLSCSGRSGPPRKADPTGACYRSWPRFGKLGVADFGGADFAHGGVAGALAGAPHVPTGDSAVGPPTLAEGEEFLGLGHVLLA